MEATAETTDQLEARLHSLFEEHHVLRERLPENHPKVQRVVLSFRKVLREYEAAYLAEIGAQ